MNDTSSSQMETPRADPAGNGINPQTTTKGWLILVGIPAAMTLFTIWLIGNGMLGGEVVGRQLVNCYFIWEPYFSILEPFVAFLLFGAGAFTLASRLGAEPIKTVNRHPGRFCALLSVLAIVGSCFLYTNFLSHSWFGWSPAMRIRTTAFNLATVTVVTIIFQLLIPLTHTVPARPGARGAFVLAILFWAYYCASLFRMLSIFTEIE